MFCTNCGTEIAQDSLFCGSCGTKASQLDTDFDSTNNSNYEEAYSNNEGSFNNYDNGQNSNYANGQGSNYANGQGSNYANGQGSNYANGQNMNYNSNGNSYSNNGQNGYSNNGSNAISFDSALVTDTLAYLKNIFISPVAVVKQSANMAPIMTGILAVLSLLITILSFNLFLKDSYYLYFLDLDSGKLVLNSVIYVLAVTSGLFACSKSIAKSARKDVSWLTILNMVIVTVLLRSILFAISLIFISSNLAIAIGLLLLSDMVSLLLLYQGVIETTGSSAKDAFISLITSYSAIILVGYLFFS